MSNVRSIFWLAIGTALVVGAHFALDVRGGASRVVRRTTLCVDADEVSAFSVRRGDGAESCLSRADGGWRLVEPFHASADSRTVLRLLDALAFAPIDDFMDDSELATMGRRLSDFGLETPRVTVRTEGPRGAETFAFGSETPAGDGVYVAVSGEKAVFVVGTNVLSAVDLDANGLRSRSLFAIGADEIGAFDVRRAAGSFMRFARDGETWRMTEPEDSPASAAKVTKFLSTVLEARAADFVWPVGASNETDTASVALLAGYGLDPESAVTVTLKGADGADRLLSLGKEADKGFVYALAHNGGAVVTVDASFKDLVLSGAEGFVDTRLFPYEESSVTTVSISDGADQYLLAKGEDGLWRLDAPVAAPADPDEASSLVARLLAIHLSSADASGIAVCLSTNDKPVRVSREAVLGRHRLEDLRSKDIAKIDPSRVRRIVSTPSGGKPTAVVYDSDRRAWNVESSPGGGVADAAAIESMLAALNPLRAETVVTLSVGTGGLGRYGLETPAHVIAVDRAQEDSVRRNLLVGDKAPGGRYATFGSSDAVFVLGEDTLGRLVAPLVGE